MHRFPSVDRDFGRNDDEDDSRTLDRSGRGLIDGEPACSSRPGGRGSSSIAAPAIPISHSYEIREVSIDGRVRDQVAEVQVSQTFHNPGSFQLEAEFLFPLPEEGAIQNFVLMVDGRELPGRLLPKDEARRIYEEIVRTKRDPALLEYMGRGLYRTSVFPIPPGADRKVTMRYTQLCKRDRDVVEFAYPLSTQKFTAKPIQRLIVQRLDPEQGGDQVGLLPERRCPDRSLRRPRGRGRASSAAMSCPSNDFRLVYTLAEGAFSASVLSYRPSESEDGYFLLLASPEVKAADTRPLPKTVIFVIDRSGSMAGKKIEQARKALKSVLNNLRDEDLFNIVVYDDRVESFKPELQRYGSRGREEAERFVDNIREGGSTNIDSALKTALAMIHDTSRPSYVLFLTDGLPTAGETRELAIAENCRQANARRARVFCFGVGYDVNARLLDRLSGGNSGTSEYVKPDEDIETPRRPVLFQDDQPGPDRHPPRAGGHRHQPDLSPRRPRPVRRRPDRLGRPLPAVGHDDDPDHGQGRRRAPELRVPRRAGRRLPGTELRLRRTALGRAAARRPDRPDRHARPEQGAGRRAGGPEHEIWHPHALHLVPGRRTRAASRASEQTPSELAFALRELEQVDGQLGVAQRDFKQAYMRAQRGSDATRSGPRDHRHRRWGLGNFSSNIVG